MTNEEILDGNKLIAQFLGLTIITDGISLFDTNYKQLVKYNESWNDLMPVVEKIEKLGSNRFNDIGITTYSYFEIRNTHINLRWCKDHKYQLHIEVIPKWKDGYNSGGYKKYVKIPVEKECTKIEAIWLACVEFIKFWNKSNK